MGYSNMKKEKNTFTFVCLLSAFTYNNTSSLLITRELIL